MPPKWREEKKRPNISRKLYTLEDKLKIRREKNSSVFKGGLILEHTGGRREIQLVFEQMSYESLGGERGKSSFSEILSF